MAQKLWRIFFCQNPFPAFLRRKKSSYEVYWLNQLHDNARVYMELFLKSPANVSGWICAFMSLLFWSEQNQQVQNLRVCIYFVPAWHKSIKTTIKSTHNNKMLRTVYSLQTLSPSFPISPEGNPVVRLKMWIWLSSNVEEIFSSRPSFRK